MKIIHFDKLKERNWSGGTTTEIYRFPSDTLSDYNIRISVASIIDSPSTFTRLPGIQRTLVLLDGELELNHNGLTEFIHQFECSRFDGDCLTRSNGVARVLNLMSPKKLTYAHDLCTIDVTDKETIIKGKANILDALFLPLEKVKINGQLISNNTLLLLDVHEEIRLQSLSSATILRISIH